MILSEISFLSNSQHKLIWAFYHGSTIVWFRMTFCLFNIIQWWSTDINIDSQKTDINISCKMHFGQYIILNLAELITTLPSFFLKRTSIFTILGIQLMHLSKIIKFQHYEFDKWLILPSPKLIYTLWKMTIKDSKDQWKVI